MSETRPDKGAEADEALGEAVREAFQTAEPIIGKADSGTFGSIEHIAQFFAYEHLPQALQAVSRPFCLLAQDIIMDLPRNPERTVALRKLLEAKDAAVRASLAK